MNKRDIVHSSLGDGGAASHRFIQNEILSRFKHPSLATLSDASIVRASGLVAVTADTYIVDPIEFPGGDIGRMSVSGVSNDLLAVGAIPKWLTFCIVLGEGMCMIKLRRILDSVKLAASESGAEIITGDTKVLPNHHGVELIISASAIGEVVSRDTPLSFNNIRPGDRIIVTGNIADHSIAVLSQREGLGFESRVSSDCQPLTHMLANILHSEVGLRAMRDPTRGGVLGVLHDIVDATSLDVVLDRSIIPIQNEVSYACEMLGLDPLELVNEGRMVVICSPEAEGTILKSLRTHQAGANATTIGVVNQRRYPRAYVRVASPCDELLTRSEGERVPRLC